MNLEEHVRSLLDWEDDDPRHNAHHAECWICGKDSRRGGLQVTRNVGPNYETHGVHRKCEYPDGQGRARGRHLNVDRDWDQRGSHLR